MAKGVKTKGRPSDYSLEVAALICEQLTQGISLRTVCKDENMPAASTVFLWLQQHKEFSEQYARAKQESADAMAEDILEIADNSSQDEIETPDGRIVVNNEFIQRSRLRVDTRKWLMAKMKPKVYGDKYDVTSDGKALPAPILGGLAKTDPTPDDAV